MAPPTLSLRELNRATLARQLLLERAAMTPVAAVERLVALQAQVARPPFVGLWTRLARFTRDDLHARLHDKTIVRATALRGTLHLMSADDFVAVRGALQPMLSAGMQSILRQRAGALDVPALVAEGRKFFARPHGFDALRDHLIARFPDGEERAMGYAVRTHLPLVQVPTADRWGFPGSADFTVAERWLGRKLAAAATPHALVRRYLAAFGPATAGDAQTWSGMAGLREVFEALRPELVTFRDERKRELFDLPDAPRPPADTVAPPRLLPDFDNLVLGHGDRRRVIADAHRGAVVTKNLQVRATFLVDGVVAGTWRIERKGAAATLILTSFAAIARPVRAALDDEAERLVRFVEDDARTWAVRFER